MDTLQIKLNLIKQITQIEDAKLLERLQAFLNTSGSLINENISIQNKKKSEFTDTEDFTDYIKEWVKDME